MPTTWALCGRGRHWAPSFCQWKGLDWDKLKWLQWRNVVHSIFSLNWSATSWNIHLSSCLLGSSLQSTEQWQTSCLINIIYICLSFSQVLLGVSWIIGGPPMATKTLNVGPTLQNKTNEDMELDLELELDVGNLSSKPEKLGILLAFWLRWLTMLALLLPLFEVINVIQNCERERERVVVFRIWHMIDRLIEVR